MSHRQRFLKYLVIIGLSQFDRGFCDSESIMLSSAEREIIGLKKKTSFKNNEIRLDGICYLSETKWTVWINEEAYHMNHMPESLEIIDVQEDHIRFRVKGSDDSDKVYFLKVNHKVRIE